MKESIFTGLQFLEYIRNQKYCCICLQVQPVEPHHLSAVGMGGNSKKEIEKHYTAIPVCRKCHREYHDRGEKFQSDKYKMNHWKENAKYLKQFLWSKNENNKYRVRQAECI